VIRVNSKRHGLSVISTVTNKGQMRWRIFDGALNTSMLIDFLRRLIKGASKKVFLILDNLRVHHAKPVNAWLAEHADAIEAFYLPSYSPELNPDESLNADLKQAIGSKVPVRTKARLRVAADEHMQFIAANRDRVRAYFHDPIVKYAA
jgi:transposase